MNFKTMYFKIIKNIKQTIFDNLFNESCKLLALKPKEMKISDFIETCEYDIFMEKYDCIRSIKSIYHNF